MFSTINFIHILFVLSIRVDHLNIAKLLIANGTNVNEVNKHGDSPLHWAILHGELLFLFLINLITHKIKFILSFLLSFRLSHIFLQKGGTNVAKILIDNNADIHARNSNKETPLLLVAKSNGKFLFEVFFILEIVLH